MQSSKTLFHVISTHALREEGDLPPCYVPLFHVISTHALREEGDSGGLGEKHLQNDFYPRPPRGGRRARERVRTWAVVFLPTPSARRATRPPRLSTWTA